MCGVTGAYSLQGENVIPALSISSQKLQNRGASDSQGSGISNGQYIQNAGETPFQFFPRIAEKTSSHMGATGLRYACEGDKKSLDNVPPIEVNAYGRRVHIASNGNIPYAKVLHDWLEANGYHHSTTTDTESLGALLLKEVSEHGIKNGVQRVIQELDDSAFSTVALFPDDDTLVAYRDARGYRPLSMHWDESRGLCVFASENPALDRNLYLDTTRKSTELARGEIVIADKTGVNSWQVPTKTTPSFCSFEYIYFARPDSTLRGLKVASARANLGKMSWRLNPIEGDFYIVPDSESGDYAAMGFAHASGRPHYKATPKERYPIILPNGVNLSQRGFMAADQADREFIAENRLHLEDFVKNRRIAYVTDSVVRGTTIMRNLRSFAEMGAESADVRITYGPVMFPCHWGIDYRGIKELAINGRKFGDVEDVNQFMLKRANEEMGGRIRVNSWAYMTVEGLEEVLGKGTCMKCLGVDFDGNVKLPHFLQEFAGREYLEML